MTCAGVAGCTALAQASQGNELSPARCISIAARSAQWVLTTLQGSCGFQFPSEVSRILSRLPAVQLQNQGSPLTCLTASHRTHITKPIHSPMALALRCQQLPDRAGAAEEGLKGSQTGWTGLEFPAGTGARVTAVSGWRVSWATETGQQCLVGCPHGWTGSPRLHPEPSQTPDWASDMQD